MFKQPEGDPMAVTEQIAVLLAATEDLLDPLPLEGIETAVRRIAAAVPELPEAVRRIESDEAFAGEERW